jgi:hypothetical protein
MQRPTEVTLIEVEVCAWTLQILGLHRTRYLTPKTSVYVSETLQTLKEVVPTS